MKDNDYFSPERPIRSDFSRGRPSYVLRRIVTLGIIAFFVLGAGVWWWSHSRTPGEIPTIKAEGSYKERPEQPGGIDIPHQDVQVYQEIEGGAADEKTTVEHMLPPPEQPTAPAATAAAGEDQEFVTAPATQVENISPAAGLPALKEAEAPKKMEVPTPVAVAPTPAPAPVKQVEQHVPPKVVSPVVTAEPAPAAPVAATKGGVVVQFAASTDERAATDMAQKLQSKYHGTLGNARLHPVKADLGAKGVFYRIQSQPLPEGQAKSICASVKKANAGCLLVRP